MVLCTLINCKWTSITTLNKIKLGYCSLRYLDILWIVSVAIVMTYYHHVDHAWPTELAGDDAYILWYYIVFCIGNI